MANLILCFARKVIIISRAIHSHSIKCSGLHPGRLFWSNQSKGPIVFFDWIRNSAVKKFIRGDQSALFEPSGNFIYRISVREIEKMMTAINNPTIAVRFFNTFYHPKLASQKYGLNPGILLTKLCKICWFFCV